MKVTIDNLGSFSLGTKEYIGAGGEASIYKKDNLAIKIYHDAQKCIPWKKMEELDVIPCQNVLKPLYIVKDPKGIMIGYAMQYIKDSVPLCKLFTKTFKDDNNLTTSDIVEITKYIQKTIVDIHRSKCLIVDGNEMNYLIDSSLKTPLFIDVDSYQTPSYRATAIMESIRDRLIKNNKWNEMSDWFSFAIVTFQLYMGIHPYKGKHPNYAMKDWTKRMDDGISVFDPHVQLPSVCPDFSIIPKRHLEWFKSLFVNNNRSVPPLPDGISPVAVIDSIIKIIKGNESFDTKLKISFPEKIVGTPVQVGSVVYFISQHNVYKEDNPDNPIYEIKRDSKRFFIAQSNNNDPVFAEYDGSSVILEDYRKNTIGIFSGVDNIFSRNGNIYTLMDNCLYENIFVSPHTSGKILHSTRLVGNILKYSSKVFNGLVYQDILGKAWLTIPYQNGKCYLNHVQELDTYRVIDAKSERNICVVIGEKKGIYTRLIFVFDKEFSSYTVRIQEDIQYQGINFTVLQNGLCILLVESDSIEVFKDNSTVKKVDKAPFDHGMRLFNKDSLVFFMDRKNVYQVSLK